MAVELIINITLSETRIACIDDGVLQEIHIERESQKGIAGNIYKGRVSRVLPGMQAAFVDIGLDRAAFLHVADIISHTTHNAGNEKKNSHPCDITRLVRPGQDLMVQVIKDPLGTKGPRLTTDITLPSRYLVLVPESACVAVSLRIENSAERDRLKNIVAPYCDKNCGFIIRTAAEGVTENELIQDAAFLKRLWDKIIERKKRSSKSKYKLYGELALSQRILRDFASTTLGSIWIDSHQAFDLLTTFTREYIPEMTDKLKLYTSHQPIFDFFKIENAIQHALDRKVVFKSGGYIIIDQTEALTTIDINTGAFVGYRNLDETIFNTNIEAAQEIARQLRMRNLGGIIIIDFIDMTNEEHQRQVLNTLELALSKDRVKTSVSNFSPLGLVEVTRKRIRESIEHVLCSVCPTCHGRGTIKSVETICYEILREIMRFHHVYQSGNFLVYTAPAVGEALAGEEAHALRNVEQAVGKKVKIQIEPFYSRERFDVVMM